MGGADIIPGVSGGTMALIVGIYERLIASISHGASAVFSLVRLDVAEARAHLRAVEWGLVVPLGLGVVTALAVGARIIPVLLERYPMHCLGLFFGLVAASIYIPWQRIGRRSAAIFGVAVAGAVAAFWLTGFPPAAGFTPSLPLVFACASVAICAMILPGVSGAFLLKVMGVYEATLLAVNARDVSYVLVFVAGAAVGIGLFSKVLNWLLRHYHDVTMAALVGLMAGSLRALWPWQGDDRGLHLPAPGDPVWGPVALFVLGFTFVLGLTLLSDRLEEKARAERGE